MDKGVEDRIRARVQQKIQVLRDTNSSNMYISIIRYLLIFVAGMLVTGIFSGALLVFIIVLAVFVYTFYD